MNTPATQVLTPREKEILKGALDLQIKSTERAARSAADKGRVTVQIELHKEVQDLQLLKLKL